MRLFIPLFLLFFSASCGGCSSLKNKKNGATKIPSLFKSGRPPVPSRGIVTVTTTRVALRDAPLSTTAQGKADASEKVQIKSPVDARVQKVAVEEGSIVQAGDILLTFDSESSSLKLNLARASVKEAEAAIGLIESGATVPAVEDVPQETVEETEGNASPNTPPPAKNQLEFFQAQLEKAKAEVELYESMTDQDKRVDSPFAGIVTRKDVVDGATVAQDRLLFEIARLDPVLFVFSTTSDIVPYLDHGAEISVSFDDLPGEAFGKLSVSNDSKGSGNFLSKMKLSNPELTVRPEMTGTVRINVSERRRVAMIPEGALIHAERSEFVFLAEPAGDGKSWRAKRASVDALDAVSGLVPVVKGLSDGDTLISSAEGGVGVLSDGAAIEVQEP